jgi:hypothetical protein
MTATAALRVEAAAGATTSAVLPSDGSVHPSNARQFADHTQRARAKAAGISTRSQRTLDRLAQLRPDLLAEVRAGRLSAHRAAVEAGIVREAAEDSRAGSSEAPDRPPWQAVREAITRITSCPLPAEQLATSVPFYRAASLARNARAAIPFLAALAEHLERRCGCLDRQRLGDRP